MSIKTTGLVYSRCSFNQFIDKSIYFRIPDALGTEGPKLPYQDIPSGKLSHNYGKSPFSMGKSTINGNFLYLEVKQPQSTSIQKHTCFVLEPQCQEMYKYYKAHFTGKYGTA